MIKQFTAVSNSTILDVCLNIYGTLNLLGKLIDDNNIVSANLYPTNGQTFLFDDSFVNVQSNQNLSQNFNISSGENQLKYTTQ